MKSCLEMHGNFKKFPGNFIHNFPPGNNHELYLFLEMMISCC